MDTGAKCRLVFLISEQMESRSLLVDGTFISQKWLRESNTEEVVGVMSWLLDVAPCSAYIRTGPAETIALYSFLMLAGNSRS